MNSINPYVQIIANYLNVSVLTATIILTIISIWTITWKGIALWKSSKKNHIIWFIVFLLINTIGVLEILYIYIFSDMNLKGNVKKKNKVTKKSTKKIKKKRVK